MNRLIEYTVFSGLVTAWRFALSPTSRSSVLVMAPTDGVVPPPSRLGITTGSPPCITATTEFVVPRSIPIILLISAFPPESFGHFRSPHLSHIKANPAQFSRSKLISKSSIHVECVLVKFSDNISKLLVFLALQNQIPCKLRGWALKTWIGRESRATVPWSRATNPIEAQSRFAGFGVHIRPRLALLSHRFEVEFYFVIHLGQIARIVSEDRVNRRRILAGILSVGLLGLIALFLPSLHKNSEPASRSVPSFAQTPSEPVNSRAESEPSVLPAPVVEAKAAPLPPVPQSVAGLPDIDPHKAFGSKNAPVTMEVFSDFRCPACKTLFTTTHRRLVHDYGT